MFLFSFLNLAAFMLTMAIGLVAIFHPRILSPVRIAISVVLAALLISSPALAQAVAAAAASGNTANTLFHIPQAAWDEINALGAAIFLALGGMVSAMAYKWLRERSPAAAALARDAFGALLNNAAKYGVTQAQAAEKKVGDIDVGNAMVAAAANFIIAQGPVLAKKNGYDVTTPEGRAAIVRSVTLRVADLQNAPQAAPASLPLPPAVAMAGTGTAPEPTAKPPITG